VVEAQIAEFQHHHAIDAYHDDIAAEAVAEVANRSRGR
jgi:hypothetical protein